MTYEDDVNHCLQEENWLEDYGIRIGWKIILVIWLITFSRWKIMYSFRKPTYKNINTMCTRRQNYCFSRHFIAQWKLNVLNFLISQLSLLGPQGNSETSSPQRSLISTPCFIVPTSRTGVPQGKIIDNVKFSNKNQYCVSS